ncbi:efflux RND transporter periplasmic adaptor subunit [Granulicella tundricola]|uniref:Efflux transporter, RND family, MFP subunit n=1 Tax=Granulicella tundricola (strain ATCC BAA-1859 / DSM 23138 / MP5ACTX9) TaxID=1198114 RepID=E8WWW8_GRATM|nr:efflux RND transporter periplasmic adaptor subunit [Granulicella tundricola]ADW68529.1 efflux transporter, RND family, MFP subunit [Granulicella tundricola MP5ACTX9]
MAPKKKSRKVLYFSISAVVLVGVLGLTAVAHGHSGAIDPAQLVRVERTDIAKSVVATGKVHPITQVEVKSKASGIVTQLSTDINDTVRRGQVLAQLDQQEILDQVAAQKATLAAAESNAHAAESAIVLDRVNAEAPDLPMIKHTYDRARQMNSDGVVSAQALDDAQQRYLAANNTRDKALSQITIDTAKLRQAQAQVAQAEAALKQLQEQLSYTTITSPMDGVVLSRDVEKGDAVSSILVLGSTATLVMTVGDIHQVYVQGKVDEADIGKVYMDQPARIKVESFKDKTFLGKVTRIAPLGVEKDNVTTFEVRVSIDNPGGELKSNMTANAEILLDEHKNVLAVPEQAVKFDKDRKATVEIPDKTQKTGRKFVPVVAGLSNGSKVEIVSGLKQNDQVILQQ